MPIYLYLTLCLAHSAKYDLWTLPFPSDLFLFVCVQVRDLENLKDFGECVITLQACVIKKFLQGFMAPKQKKKQEGEESRKTEEVDEEKKLAEEARVSNTYFRHNMVCYL